MNHTILSQIEQVADALKKQKDKKILKNHVYLLFT